MENNNTKMVVGAVVAAIVIFIIGIFVGRYSARTDQATQNQQGDNTQTSNTVTEVPADTRVPDAGEQGLPENVAAPASVAPAAPGVEASKRNFDIKIQGNKFIPDTIIVKQGDTTSINFTAVDKAYDFTQPDYGLSAPIAQGKTQLIEFGGTTPGKYQYFCKSCGGPSAGPVGYIIVVPK